MALTGVPAASTDADPTTRLGIDEAGRGPAIGPLVVAGVLIDPASEAHLTDLGVRDSKALSAERRRSMVEGIRAIAMNTRILAFAPRQLAGNLNAVELSAIAHVVDELAPDALYVDAPVGPRAIPTFVDMVQQRCPSNVMAITAENQADANYPVVAAASILAKVYRDAAIERLHAIYGDFGSGYPADPKTKRFLNEWYAAHRSFPACVRTRWGTVQAIVREHSAKRLIETSPDPQRTHTPPRPD